MSLRGPIVYPELIEVLDRSSVQREGEDYHRLRWAYVIQLLSGWRFTYMRLCGVLRL
jgi:hypothetical protein